VPGTIGSSSSGVSASITKMQGETVMEKNENRKVHYTNMIRCHSGWGVSFEKNKKNHEKCNQTQLTIFIQASLD